MIKNLQVNKTRFQNLENKEQNSLLSNVGGVSPVCAEATPIPISQPEDPVKGLREDLNSNASDIHQ